jgi:hypothetical protein
MSTNTRINEKYIKVDDNKLINEKAIKWIKKIDDCLEICTRSIGCDTNTYKNSHKLCKIYNPDSYKKMNKYFE